MPSRVYRPDLSEHFILVHPAKHYGIAKFNATKTEAWVAKYRFDDDGDLHIGRFSWVTVKDSPKGKSVHRKDGGIAYLHDFVKAPVNPYA